MSIMELVFCAVIAVFITIVLLISLVLGCKGFVDLLDRWIDWDANKIKKKMKKGHKKWCDFCETEPTEVYSVQTCEMEEL